MAANFPSITQTSIIFLFFIQRHKDKKIIECGRVGNNSDRWKKYKRLKQKQKSSRIGRDSIPEKRTRKSNDNYHQFIIRYGCERLWRWERWWRGQRKWWCEQEWIGHLYACCQTRPPCFFPAAETAILDSTARTAPLLSQPAPNPPY